MGLVWPIVDRMIRHHLKVDAPHYRYEPDLLDMFKTTVAKDLTDRWNTIMESCQETVLLSFFLDPRLPR